MIEKLLDAAIRFFHPKIASGLVMARIDPDEDLL